MVDRFSCPACGVAVRPKTPVADGTRVRCPRCDRAITVRGEEVVEPEAEPPQEVAYDERDRPPVRRGSLREEEERVEEEPRPRRKRPRRKGSGSGLKVALLIAGLLLLVAGIGTGGYFLLVHLFESPASRRVRAIDEITATLSGVKDQASAEAARPALVRMAGRLKEEDDRERAKLEQGLKKLNENPEMVREAFDKAMKNPKKAEADYERFTRDMEPHARALDRLMAEGARVLKVPGGKELLTAFFDAWGQGGALLKMSVAMRAELGTLFEGGPTSPPGFGPRPGTKATKENFDRVRVGMTEAEVIDTLGPPDATRTNDDKGTKDLRFAVGFVTIKDGKVYYKFP